MDHLRILKSKIEGSHYQLQQPAFDPALSSQLKHRVVSHVPASISEQDKAKLAELVTELLDGHVKRIVYCCLLNCPFATGAQSREMDQAKNNTLFLVYVARDEQFFSLATQHEKGLADVIDQVNSWAKSLAIRCYLAHL